MSPETTVTLVLLAALALGVVALERGGGGAKEVALVATLGTGAAAGRVLFAPLPSVQPVTTICLVAGAALGARAGLAVGPVAALVSNSFLGQGPWTPAQMALWSLAGLSGAALRPVARRTIALAALAFAWGFVFGIGMNLWFLAAFGPEVSPEALLLSSGRSFPFELAGAIGNGLLALAAGPALMRLLERYALRIRADIVWDAPPEGAAPGG